MNLHIVRLQEFLKIDAANAFSGCGRLLLLFLLLRERLRRRRENGRSGFRGHRDRSGSSRWL